MSGGSFNYLYSKRGADLRWAVETIRDMRDELVKLDPRRGLPEAIRLFDDLIRKAENDEVDAIADRLDTVMRAVEWWRSCDSSEDDVTEALAKLVQPTELTEKTNDRDTIDRRHPACSARAGAQGTVPESAVTTYAPSVRRSCTLTAPRKPAL